MSLRTTSRFIAAAQNAITDIASEPGIGTLLSNDVLPDLPRSRISGIPKRLIIYRVDEKALYIYRVIHGARNLEAILNDPSEPDL